MTNRFLAWPRLVAVAAFMLLFATGHRVCAQPPGKDAYQDFRNKAMPANVFRLGGPDPDNEVKAEKEGLRITLPAEREQHHLAEVNAAFPLTGDFEFTATYEILSAKAPLKGYGVGVNLTVSTAAEPKKFGKLCRVLRAKEGNVYLAESWPKYQQLAKKTEVQSGQLRLARVGPSLYFLVSDGAGRDFENVWEVKNYGTDDISYAGFQVADSGEPGNPVDARLIDLRVRLGKFDADKLTMPSPLAAAIPAEAVPAPPAVAVPRWLIALAIVTILFFVLLLAGTALVWMYMRARTP
jgi:hypothetical protein